MLYKSMEYPLKLKYYEALKNRCEWTKQQSDDYWASYYGYKGEQEFVALLDAYQDVVVLWDVSLSVERLGTAQFDVIALHGHTLTHFDVKNFRGKYTFEDGKLVSSAGKHISNIDQQLSRAHEILKRFAGRRYTVESKLVFINPDFRLDAKCPSDNWLFRGETLQHLKQYRTVNYNYEENLRCADYLARQHAPLEHLNVPIKTPFENIMPGLKCPSCEKITTVTPVNEKKCSCTKCGTVYYYRDILRHNVMELYYLKGSSFTINEALAWCGFGSRTTMRRVLSSTFDKVGVNKATKYTKL